MRAARNNEGGKLLNEILFAGRAIYNAASEALTLTNLFRFKEGDANRDRIVCSSEARAFDIFADRLLEET